MRKDRLEHSVVGNAVAAPDDEVTRSARNLSKERVLRFRRPGETDARPHVVVISSVAVTEAVFNLVRRPDAFPAHSQIKGEVALKPEIILGVKVCLAEAIFRFRQTVSLVVACKNAIQEVLPSTKTCSGQCLSARIDATEGPEAALRAARDIVQRLKSLVYAHPERVAREDDGVVVDELMVALIAVDWNVSGGTDDCPAERNCVAGSCRVH